ncbi:hypothetical protein [Chondrinema litorale]|uniref:hypothetical protein n=1 Tax=Chondrinema litorale TaxID=2994555 RepID=UPI002543870B|nr:hypothetical protein [Chondrinema litorale]UZS00273.1 hypothetical protein OQ292_40745 [Chondrinema litorale]
MKYLIITLCFLAGFFKAVRDTLMFHFSSSIFKNWNEQFFNPAISWMNKYKNFPEDKSEAFFLSKTVLVSLTDAWHLSELLMLICLLTIVFIKTSEKVIYKVIAVIAFFTSFNIFYYLMG